ncbi:50S ribosomal protein L24 [Blochmannia endosymbiont of Colobopsis nipponica]|uniref:50S ribosomal protein L24 n=1 Tax=Blochmannia endosymbiont of Colobopsis nipponica TaxID=2681987 RepID=UPI00178387C1|nr:50S ribosomal protein L24 [Blochmannia endosymbiont of Colobopsis nipponica]QOI11214.1 50S ribosomal protein L24 [Blochmannia endosymbiont of Colobopsis nipponica]
MSAKIRCGDEVIVLKGANKGKHGKVKFILASGRVFIEGLNLVKKHQKSVPAMKKLGGIFEKESPIDISNIAIFNVTCGRLDKVVFKIKDGKKVRVFKSSGENV